MTTDIRIKYLKSTSIVLFWFVEKDFLNEEIPH